MVDYPTLDAHKKQLIEGDFYRAWPTEHTKIHLSALENAWTYLVDVEAMRKVQANNAHMSIENPLWIELSQPIKTELWAGHRLPLFKSVAVCEGLDIYRDIIDKWEWNTDAGDVTAMLFFSPKLECIRLGIEIPTVLTWRLMLIHHKDGLLFQYYLSYDVQKREWLMPFNECPHGTPPCERCHATGTKYLNTWKTRFRQALTLIQKNRYRPGNIPVIH